MNIMLRAKHIRIHCAYQNGTFSTLRVEHNRQSRKKFIASLTQNIYSEIHRGNREIKMRNFAGPFFSFFFIFYEYVSGCITIVAHSQFINSLAPQYLSPSIHRYSHHVYGSVCCVCCLLCIWIYSEMRPLIFAAK